MSEVIKIVPDGHQHKKMLPTPQPEPPAYYPQLPYELQKDVETVSQLIDIDNHYLSFMLAEGTPGYLSQYTHTLIKELRQEIEKRAYIWYFSSRKTYLQSRYLKHGLYEYYATPMQMEMRELLSGVMQNSHEHIVSEIDEGELQVYKKKDMNKKDLAELERLDQVRLIKIREGELKSKLSLLNERMDQVRYFSESTLQKTQKISIKDDDAVDIDYKMYALNSNKTKLAQEYIAYMRNKKKERLYRRKKRQSHQKYMYDKLYYYLLYNEKIMNEEKRQQIIAKLYERKKKKKEYEDKEKDKLDKIMKFLDEHRKNPPLHKRLEDKFKKNILSKEEELQAKLIKYIHYQHEPLTPSKLEKHRYKYFEDYERISKKKKEELEMEMKWRNRPNNIPYRSHFHYIIEKEQAPHIKPYEESLYRDQRRKEYGRMLKAEHKPVVDPEKKKELEELLIKEEMKKKKMKRKVKIVRREEDDTLVPEVEYEEIKYKDAKKEGNKYLEYARRIGYRMKLRAESAKRKKQDEAKSDMNGDSTIVSKNILEMSEPRKNKSISYFGDKYRENIRHRKHLNSWNDDLKNDRISSQYKVDRVLIKSILLDNRAKDREQILRYAHFETPLHEIREKAAVDEHYISSIKAKVALLDMAQ